jgi:hypothetical protein
MTSVKGALLSILVLALTFVGAGNKKLYSSLQKFCLLKFYLNRISFKKKQFYRFVRQRHRPRMKDTILFLANSLFNILITTLHLYFFHTLSPVRWQGIFCYFFFNFHYFYLFFPQPQEKLLFHILHR